MTSYTTYRVEYTPSREVLLSNNGVMLATTEARYDTLNEYVLQFARPLSLLTTKEIAFYQFSDSIVNGCTLLVECHPVEVCGRCGEPLDACDCPC